MAVDDTMAEMADRLSLPVPNAKSRRHRDPADERHLVAADRLVERIMAADIVKLVDVHASLPEHGGNMIEATAAALQRHHADLLGGCSPTTVASVVSGVWNALAATAPSQVTPVTGSRTRPVAVDELPPPGLPLDGARAHVRELIEQTKQRLKDAVAGADDAEGLAHRRVQDAADAATRADTDTTRAAYEVALREFHLAGARKRKARKDLKEANFDDVDVESFAAAIAGSDVRAWRDEAAQLGNEVAELAARLAGIFRDMREGLVRAARAGEEADALASQHGLDYRTSGFRGVDSGVAHRIFGDAFHRGVRAVGLDSSTTWSLNDELRRSR